MNSDDLYKTHHKAEYRVANFPTRRQLKLLVLYWTIYACKFKFICYSLEIIYNTEPSVCMYIGFKTFFYVARHLDSIVPYLPTGLHLGFFRSWPSLSPPSSFSSTYSKYVWRYHDRPASSNGKAAALKSREDYLPSPDTSFLWMYSKYTYIHKRFTFDYASIALIMYVDKPENRMLSRIPVLTGACNKYTMRNFESHLPMVQQPNSGLDHVIVEVSRSH
jgi:hypothetical protein